METAKLFNGIDLHTSLETGSGGSATATRIDPVSYTLNLELKLRMPTPDASLPELLQLNPWLSTVLPGLEAMMPDAKVSPFFEDFYRHKVAILQRNLPRLEMLLSKHNFYDCETVMELQHKETRRRALLVQADMDVDMDGSDSDRVPFVDGTITNYQPMTSYKWPKKTAVPNQFLVSREARLKQLETEFTTRGLTPERNLELRTVIPQARYELNQLKTQSFLVATTDPYVVMPGSLINSDGRQFTPRIGDYCVVIYKNTLYPAIIGDVGPRDKIGEASFRLAREINPKCTPYNRPVSELKVSYLIFPNTADKPFDAPDLVKIRSRCEQLLNEIGGYQGDLHTWENLIKPPPTPTPTPSATPALTPAPSPGASPSASPAPNPAASPTPTPIRAPSPSPPPSPAAGSPPLSPK